ncbi:MAG: helix-turn-helix transcriptional regulator [Lentisphaeria bacterium]|nr:helix-turn-helix transcriptional regulator [Lentisphaeria bacterium]
MQADSVPLLDRRKVMPDIPLRVFNFRQPNDVLHVHNFHELVLVRRGCGVHLTEEGESPIRRGNVFLVRPGVMHTYCNVSGLEIANMLFVPEELQLPFGELAETEGYNLLFPPRNRIRGRHSEVGGVALAESQLRRAEELIGAMLIEQQRRNPGWGYFVRLHFMALFGLVCRAYPEEPEASEDEFERLTRVVDHIEAHYAEPVSLDTLAALGGCSKCTLIRMFRRAFDSTPVGYLLEFRLERGREMLRKSSLPVTEIAMRNGFSDSNYFTKLFRRRYGMSPRACRKLNPAAADR